MIKNKVKQLMTVLLAVMLLGTSVVNGGLLLVSNAEATSKENEEVKYTVSEEVSEDGLLVKVTLQLEVKENITVQEIVMPDGTIQGFTNEQIEYNATENGIIGFLLRYTDSSIEEGIEAVDGETAQSEVKELTIQVNITGIQEKEETPSEDMTVIDNEEKTEMLEISNFSNVVGDVATINMADGPVTINDDGFTQSGATTTHTGSYVLTGTYTHIGSSGLSVVVITGGTEANPIKVTLDNVKIDNSSARSAIQIGDHVTPNNVPGHVDMTLVNENELKGGAAGIEIKGSKNDTYHSTLVIGGPGKLTTAGGAGGAGIGSTLQPNAKVYYKLTINSGTIIAQGGNEAAGIGGGKNSSGGEIIVNGGNITSTGGYMGAGIGGGVQQSYLVQNLTDMSVTINGGTVVANGGDYASGIGTGFISINKATHDLEESLFKISINGTGTKVTATAGTNQGAGIGLGSSAYYDYDPADKKPENPWIIDTIQITDGAEVTATGGATYGSGIGVPRIGRIKKISIDNAKVTATGGSWGSGIGIGNGEHSYIELIEIINNSDVVAVGGINSTNGAGIGVSRNGQIEKIFIGNAKVSATGGSWGSGIGSGYGVVSSLDSRVEAIEITGDSNVTATGGASGAGIGTGLNSSVGAITISGGNVITSGGLVAPGIGSGEGSRVDSIKITGKSNVTATGGRRGTGIGTGRNSSVGAITISGGNVVASGGYVGPGIGSTTTGSHVDSIEITGKSNVTATGGVYAAGIGTGENSSVGTITISAGNTVASTSLGNGSAAGIGTGYVGGAIDSVSITGDATVVATGNWGSGIGRAQNSDLTLIANPFPIIIEQGTDVTAYAMGDIKSNGDFDATTGLRLDAPYYSAIDQECITHANSNIADYILMGDFKAIPNSTAVQEVVITNLKTRASKSVILPIGFASFATTVSEGFHRVLVNDKIFVGDPNKRQEDNLVFNMGGNENTLNAYWMLQPMSDILVDYIFPSTAPKGINVPETVTVKMNDATEEPTIIAPANWVFEGWYLEDTFTTKYDFSSIIKSNLILYGKWQYNAPANPTPKPTSRPSSGRTCQDDGFAEGYYWSESAQACVIDKVGAVSTRANTPNTGDSPNYTLAIAILSLSVGLIILVVGKKKKKTTEK